MRADVFLATYGFAKSRSAAQSLISDGNVTVNGKKLKKASENIDETAENQVNIENPPMFVGRGGYKLDFALDKFSIDVSGLTAVDIGASTGGFTDCLLKRGAVHVYAVDSGEGQLSPSLLCDSRVTNMEKYNARGLLKGHFDAVIDIAVMDVSFISQTLIIPAVASVLEKDGIFVSLIKPQFEVGRDKIGKKGIVKEEKHRTAAVNKVLECAKEYGLCCLGVSESVITGGDGNIEYVAAFKKNIIIDLQR